MIPKIKIFQNKYENPKFSFVAIIVLTGSIFEKKNEKVGILEKERVTQICKYVTA